MEPTTAPAAATDDTSPSRPVLAHTTVQPLPKHSVRVALLAAAALPVILLLVVIAVMVATNYNILNWLE